ncbi:MAG: pantetheine-phosphate adenylyltransferase [Phycisphaerales bacterium]
MSRHHQHHHLAIYPGSFDPITLGHLDVIRRARRMFDEICVAIGHNPAKQAMFSYQERLEITQTLIDEMLAAEPDGCGVRVEHYMGLTVDFARQVNAVAIVRGIRNTSDVADECQIAITNRTVADIETVFIVTGEMYAYTSSSLIKQIAAFGGPLERLAGIVSPLVIERLRKRLADPDHPLMRMMNDQLAE